MGKEKKASGDEEEPTGEEKPAEKEVVLAPSIKPQPDKPDVKMRIAAEAFNKIITAIDAVLDEGNLEWSKNGFRFCAMDPSQISMLKITCPLDRWGLKEVSEPISIGVNFDQLKRVAARFKSDASLNVTYSPSRAKLLMSVGSKEFEMPLLDLQAGPHREKEPTITDQECLTGIEHSDLNTILTNAELVSSHITFLGDPGGFLKVEARGDAVDYRDAFTTNLSASMKEPLRATFPLEFVKDGTVTHGDYTFYLKSNTPLKLTTTFNEDVQLVYWLAPRIETN